MCGVMGVDFIIFGGDSFNHNISSYQRPEPGLQFYTTNFRRSMRSFRFQYN